MNPGRSIFAQLMNFLPRHEFNKCVRQYRGHFRVRDFSCFDQFLCMAFAQLTFRESLQDIEACLRAMGPKLYHAGFRGKVSRSTLADANEHRDWRIYADFAQALIRIARPLYADEDLGLELDNTVYALDASPSTCASRSFPGRTSAEPRRRSSFTRCWTCAASPPSFTFPTANCTTSTSSTI